MYNTTYTNMTDKSNPRELNVDQSNMYTIHTLGDSIKELIDGSYEIYNSLLKNQIPTTIVCGGQSPAYYCLAMMNFPIFDHTKVNIVILPHSKGGVKSINQYTENYEYSKQLHAKNLDIRSNVIIIDGVKVLSDD